MKTKISYFCGFMILSTLTLQAQDKTYSRLAITFGPSIPMGNFANAEAGTFNHWNNSAGFAKTGFEVNLDGSYYFLHALGIGAIIGFSDHGGLNRTDIKTLGDSYTDAFAVDYSTVTTNYRYQALTILIGPRLAIPINEKLSLDINANAGLLKSLSTPEISVELEDVSQFKQASSKTSAFGWQAGAGLNYSLNKKLNLILNAGYFSSAGIKINNENRTNSAGRLVTKQSMSWINTVVGIGYTL